MCCYACVYFFALRLRTAPPAALGAVEESVSSEEVGSEGTSSTGLEAPTLVKRAYSDFESKIGHVWSIDGALASVSIAVNSPSSLA